MPKCNRETDKLRTRQECCATARDQRCVPRVRRTDMRTRTHNRIGRKYWCGIGVPKSSGEARERVERDVKGLSRKPFLRLGLPRSSYQPCER